MGNKFLYGYPVNSITRDLFFNTGSIYGPMKVIYPILISISIIIFLIQLNHRIKGWKNSKKTKTKIKLSQMLKNFFIYIVFQKNTNKLAFPAIFHSLFFISFSGIILLQIALLIDVYIFYLIYNIRIITGQIYLIWSLLLNIFISFMLFGCILTAYRRLILKPEKLNTDFKDLFPIAYIFFATSLFIYIESIRVALNGRPEFEIWSFLFYGFSFVLQLFPVGFLEINYLIFYFILTIMICGIFILAIKTKINHIIFTPINLLLFDKKSLSPKRKYNYPHDSHLTFEDEKSSIGANTLETFDFKDNIEIEACISCGRCHDVCTAVIAEKVLSPAKIMRDLKTFRDRNDNSHFIPNTISTEELDDCYACGACSEICPAFANPMKKILSLKKYSTSMLGNVNSKFSETFNNIDYYNNIYGKYPEKLLFNNQNFIPQINENESVDYLLYIGCLAKNDTELLENINNFIKVCNHANLKIATLGSNEFCCGDILLQQGNEFLFRQKAIRNIKVLSNFKIQNIITFCPHGYNVLSKEYPSIAKDELLDYNYQVSHYTHILMQIIEKKFIHFKDNFTGKNITYHDPCFSGRYNNDYDTAREIIYEIDKYNYIPLKKEKTNSICCGGGAGKFLDTDPPGNRPNDIILRAAYNTGANILATSCPICYKQLKKSRNELKDLNIDIKDISTLVFESLK